MSNVEPWFTKPWRSTVNGTRPRVAALGYLGTGVCFVIVCLLSSASAATRMLWLVLAMVFLGLGTSLAATLKHRKRT